MREGGSKAILSTERGYALSGTAKMPFLIFRGALGVVFCASLSNPKPAVAQAQAEAQAQTNATGEAPPPKNAQPTENSGPIISDEEFEQAVPQIDAGSKTSASPAEQQTSAPTDQGTAVGAEQLSPAPDISPDIDRPLEPLASFKVEPFDAKSYTKTANAKPAQVRYRYQIDGLDQLSDTAPVAPVTGKDIIGQFHDLSALEKGDSKAANGAMINARLQEDKKLLAEILDSQGYYDATVQGSIQLPKSDSGDEIMVLLTAQPGPRYELGSIRFDTPPVIPEDLITSAFAPKIGEPIVAGRILAAEANLKVVLPEQGYPFVDLGQRDILLDTKSHKGDYTLPVKPGPRSRFGDIVVSGTKPVFEPAHIEEIARFKKGQLYDSRKIDDLRQALVATGLIGTVSVQAEQTGEAAGDDTQYAQIDVEQEAGPPRTLSALAGYATGEGLKVQGGWTHHNLFPPEGALGVRGTAGTQEQGLGVTFRRSNAGRRDRTAQLAFDVDHNNFNAFEAYTGQLSGSISYDSTPIWQKRLTYSYGFALIATNEQDYDFDIGALRRRTFYVVALPGQVTWDTSDSLLDPTRGFRLSAQVSPETSLGSGAQAYLRTTFQATDYYPVSDALVVAGRARVGMIGGAARTQIAPSRRFYVGGGGSVRGYGYQDVGPKDPEARPIGGRSLVEASGEVRYRFGNYGIVGFVDAGQVYTSEVPRFTDWRVGVGVGARFYTNFGPMRLDIATPLDRQPGEARVAVYVSIGQAF